MLSECQGWVRHDLLYTEHSLSKHSYVIYKSLNEIHNNLICQLYCVEDCHFKITRPIVAVH